LIIDRSRFLANLLLEELSDGVLLLLLTSSLFVLGLLHIDLVHDGLLVTHLRHLGVSILQSIDKKVNSLVEFIKIHLHVFFLGLEVLWLLIRVEVFQLLVIIHCVTRFLLGLVSREGRLVVIFLLQLVLLLGSTRVGILLDHETESSLEGSSLNVLSGLWE
jgi:hypothetical protein